LIEQAIKYEDFGGGPELWEACVPGPLGSPLNLAL